MKAKIRILQRDKGDQIKISVAFTLDTNNPSSFIKQAYERMYLQSFEDYCSKNFLEVSIVNANTLKRKKILWKA